MSTIFTVTAQRGKGAVWVLEAPQVGAVSQVRRLDQAAEEMREAVAFLAGLREDEVQIKVVPILPDSYERQLEKSTHLQDVAARATSQAANESRLTARALRDYGLTLRDVGTIMGISHQRAAQLLH